MDQELQLLFQESQPAQACEPLSSFALLLPVLRHGNLHIGVWVHR